MPQADGSLELESHYDLHFWQYRNNPNGTFTQFTPAVSCRRHVVEAEAAHGD